jgi:hypothetical protein
MGADLRTGTRVRIGPPAPRRLVGHTGTVLTSALLGGLPPARYLVRMDRMQEELTLDGVPKRWNVEELDAECLEVLPNA